MTAEQKSKLAQGLFFGLLFLFLGYFMKGCEGRQYAPVRASGKITVLMSGVIILWGIWQCRARPK